MVKLRLSASNSMVSRAIKLLTWSDYSHVDFVLDSGDYLGSVPGKGVIVHRQKEPLEHFYHIDASYDTITNAALNQLGKPYDYTGIVGFLFNRDWQKTDSWFCSELVAASINKEIALFDAESFRITPRDISIHPLVHRIS
jgi:uncharacterized protein YycO